MKKIEVAALAKDRDRILSTLTREGTVEIVPVHKEEATASPEDQKRLRETIQLRSRLADALKEMDRRFPPENKSLFTLREKISEDDFKQASVESEALEQSLNAWEDALSAEHELKNQIANRRDQQSILEVWSDVPIDLSVTETEKTFVIYGISNDPQLFAELKTQLADEAPETALLSLKEIGKQKLLAVLTRKTDAARVRSRLTGADIHPLPLVGQEGTPAEVYARLESEITGLEANLAENRHTQKTLSEKRASFQVLYDALGEEEAKLTAAAKLGQTDRTIYFSGWIPERRAERTKKKLLETADAAVSLRDPLEGEEFPILLVNNKFNQAFEVILTLFGAPTNDESDPMPAMAPFYMLIFGMMLSDVGYGLLLTLGTAYLIYGMKVEGSVRAMSKMLMLSGVASIVWGFMFGGFFGDLVSVLSNNRVHFPALWFDPMDAPMNLLVFSMIFGIVHLFVGMGMKILNAKRFGNLWDGLFETVPWYLIITGILVLLGGSAGLVEGDLAGVLSNVGKWMMIVGAALVIIGRIRSTSNPFKGFFSGILGLYDITSWLSDILSYSRILALVLATSVIAVVFNSIAGMMLGLPTPLNYVVFAIIAIPTHLLNLALSSLSAYVHASRLQYIEMFGKFFDGGGRYYQPLRRDTKYINVLNAPEGELGDAE
ncbi:MAG TPA: V-type ATP synthase subunit I [Fastidiosipila sp.]|nr:V-type ATP synthase subunit I [Fastidiosipila sp.]